MPAKRKFIVRRNTSFKKAQRRQSPGGDVYNPSNDAGAGAEPPKENTGPTFTPGSYGPWSSTATGGAIAQQQDQIRNDVTHETLNRQIAENKKIIDETNKPKKSPEQTAAEKATEKYNQNKEEKEESIGESNEDKQGQTTAEADDITQESMDVRPEREQAEAKAQRRAQELEKAKITKEMQDKWAAREKSDKRIAHAMTGLRLAGDIADRALGAFQSLTKLGNAFLQNPFSSPMGSAKQILATTVVDTGAAIQGLTEDVGKLWGIKDGIKDPKDIAGTYKGAQYYKDQADIDAVQATFAKDLEYIGRDAFGDRFTGSNFGDLLTEAVDKGDIAAIEKVSKKLRETYDSDDPEIRKMREEVNKEEADRNNDAIPKERKFKASAKAKAFDTIYRKYLWGATNAAENIRANARKDEVAATHAQRNLRTDMKGAEQARKDAEKAQRIQDDAARRDFLMQKGNWGRSVVTIEDLLGKDAVQIDDLDTDGLPKMKESTENKIIKLLSNKKASGSTLNADEVMLLDSLKRRRENRRIALEEEVEKNGGADAYINKLLKGNEDMRFGGSQSSETNKKIINIAVMQIGRMRSKYMKEGGSEDEWDIVKYTIPEYLKFRSYKESAMSGYKAYRSMERINGMGESVPEGIRDVMSQNVADLQEEVARYWGPNANVDWSDPQVQQNAEKAVGELSKYRKDLEKIWQESRKRRGKK